MAMSSIEYNKEEIIKSIKAIENRMNDTSYYEKLYNNGHHIAAELLESVGMHLNVIEMEVGRDNEDYIELCEAVAIIGSGCLRWATTKTRTLLSASDFKKSNPIYASEKAKVEKSLVLIKRFSRLIPPNSSVAPL